MGTFIIPFEDNSGEVSSVRFLVQDTIPIANTTAIFDAVEGVTVDGDQQSFLQTKANRDGADSGPASNPLAQRENKWLLFMTESVTGVKLTREIPCADLSLLSGSEILDLTAGAGLALAQAVGSNVRGPNDNLVTLNRAIFVARDI